MTHRLGAPTAALLILALLPISLAACGSDDEDSSTSGQKSSGSSQGRDDIREFGHKAAGSEAAQAEAVVRSYLAAAAAGRWSEACSYLTRSMRSAARRLAAASKQSSGASCASYIESTYDELPPAERTAEIDVSSVRLEDSLGYVLYTKSDRGEYGIPVEREDGRWLGAGPVGTPLEA